MPEELNNQGDYISGDIGEDGKDIVVGKNIRRTQNRNDVSVNLLPSDHPANRATIADLYIALTGDPLTERPGLIKRVGKIEERLSAVENELIDIKELVIVRNENRNKIHLSMPQLLIGLAAILAVVVILSYFIGTWARVGVIDGRIGLAVPLLFDCGLCADVNHWLHTVATEASSFVVWSSFFGH